MPNVWIPSLPHRYDAATQEMVPAYDVNEAERFGELRVIVDGPVGNIETAIRDVKRISIEEDDFIMAIGDVVLVAIAISEAPAGTRILRWNKKIHEYDVLEVW